MHKQTTLVLLFVVLFFSAARLLALEGQALPGQQVKLEQDCSERVLFQFPNRKSQVNRRWVVDFNYPQVKAHFQRLINERGLDYDDAVWLWTQNAVLRASQQKPVDYYVITYKPCENRPEDRFAIQCSDPVCHGKVPPTGSPPEQNAPDPQAQFAQTLGQEIAAEVTKQVVTGAVVQQRPASLASSQQALVSSSRPCGGVSLKGKIFGGLVGAGVTAAAGWPLGFIAGGPAGMFVSSRFQNNCGNNNSPNTASDLNDAVYIANTQPPGMMPRAYSRAARLD